MVFNPNEINVLHNYCGLFDYHFLCTSVGIKKKDVTSEDIFFFYKFTKFI